MALLTTDEKELLTKAASLMEELLETLEVMQDKELVKDLRASLREAKQGKTMTLDELVRDLHLETKVYG
jgi:PHD/YefM family antitoxin component YafN of YafNO toxin-antitoxin module